MARIKRTPAVASPKKRKTAFPMPGSNVTLMLDRETRVNALVGSVGADMSVTLYYIQQLSSREFLVTPKWNVPHLSMLKDPGPAWCWQHELEAA